MIAKLETGNGFGGALRYDVRAGKGTAKELARVLDAYGVSFDYDEKGSLLINPKQVGFDFRQQAMGYTGKGTIRKPVYHWALSYSPKDKVSEEQMQKDAKEFLERIGFDDTQYVMTAHYDKDHHHLHIVTNIVNNRGKRIPTMGLIDKAHIAAAAITKERGYTWGNQSTKESISAAYKPHDRARVVLRDMVTEAVAKADSFADLCRILRAEGVSCSVIEWKKSSKKGISFAFQFEGSEHSFCGSSLRLSYNTIEARINKAQTKVYRDTWRALQPLYKDVIDSCTELYEQNKSLWNTISQQRMTIGQHYDDLRGMRSRYNELGRAIEREDRNLIRGALDAVFSDMPYVTICLYACIAILATMDTVVNVAERRALHLQIRLTHRRIERLNSAIEQMKEQSEKIFEERKVKKADRNDLRDACNALKNKLELPVIDEKFDKIERFFPTVAAVKEGNLRKSRDGYDMFFVQVDGHTHVAADIDGRVVVSEEEINGDFSLKRLTWRDDEGDYYKFNGRNLEKQNVTRFISKHIFRDYPEFMRIANIRPATKTVIGMGETSIHGYKAILIMADDECRMACNINGRILLSSTFPDPDNMKRLPVSWKDESGNNYKLRKKGFCIANLLENISNGEAPGDDKYNAAVVQHEHELDEVRAEVEKLVRQKYDGGIFRKSKIYDITVNEYERSNGSFCAEVSFEMPGKKGKVSQEVRRYHGGSTKFDVVPFSSKMHDGLIFNVDNVLRLEFAMENIEGITPLKGDCSTDYELGTANMCDYQAVATPYGKQYILDVSHDYLCKRYDRFYISAPAQEGQDARSLDYYASDGTKYSLSQIKEINEGERLEKAQAYERREAERRAEESRRFHEAIIRNSNSKSKGPKQTL